MINIILWVAIGALSGWIGYLLTKTSDDESIMPFISIGVIGGLSGGLIAEIIGISTSHTVDPGSIFNALITSALFMSIFTALLNFFGNASSS